VCGVTGFAVAALVLTGEPSVVAATSGSAPVVHVDGGRVQGVTGTSVTTFLGIPYAAPPLGTLRWRPPQPVRPWHGVRDASQFGPSCPQDLVRMRNPFLPPGPISEDCLYLNVYTPSVGQGGSRGRPVLLWIHGGGLVQDGARNYDGSKLAADGAVVVTINYRLGALGFLANAALASTPGGAAGNYGLMDQQAALRWVQRNIARFGGDPGNVTIAGQSAGGLSVLAHLVSQGSRRLFQRAVVQSGTFALNQLPLSTAEAAGAAFAASVHCTTQVASCLRNASVSDLVDNFGVEIPGVVDGAVLTETIGTALANGRFARVPVLNGITHDEERLFVDGLSIAVSQGTNVPVAEPITPDNYESDIASVLGVSSARAAAIAVEYPLSAYSAPDVAFSTLVSDANFACSALQVDRWTSRHVPTYAYQFNDDNAPVVIAPPGHFPVVATHGSELPYLFDQPNTPFPATLNSDQQNLAATMRTAWTTFAGTGSPSSSVLAWPSYRPGGLQISLTTPASSVDTTASAEHHCGFWSTN
jgi:para-nitrobenzyl esterase